MASEVGHRCRRSHPAHPHTLTIRHELTTLDCSTCGKIDSDVVIGWEFYCTVCSDVKFHHGCAWRMKKIRHPYHIQHPLTLTFRNEIHSDSISPVHGTLESKTISFEFDKCTWCGEDLDETFYYCSMCNFCLDSSCSDKDPLPMIPEPKCHHHPLFLFPRPSSFPCDACGLVNKSESTYICFLCNYMVHESCIGLPRVIKITRHPHRLFYTPSLPPAFWTCRVCYKAIDIKYGQYSCNQDGCYFAVHSKCATHHQVWDGTELEWEPEEVDEEEDVASFKKVGDDLIKYFCHEHHLRMVKYDVVRDARKQCQACVLPIDSRDFYNCEECYFCLHEVCASLPRKLDHALHYHRLVLDPYPVKTHDSLKCMLCSRKSTGFRYKCGEDTCGGDFYDVRCILVPDYMTHKSHEHPLFIFMSYDGGSKVCNVCDDLCWEFHLQCTTCEFGMCYQCVTIPQEIDYKYDEHPLTLCYGEDVDGGTYWCEICEKKLDPTKWFYTCNKCCITIHRECVFGRSIYLKHGSSFSYYGCIVDVIGYVSNTRPICSRCKKRCPDSMCFTVTYQDGKFFCTLKCLFKT